MDNKLKITVIIPVYNGKKYLQDAINSVNSQTYKPIELLIIDDGSTDGSTDDLVIHSSHFPIHIIRQLNQGQSAARNYGVELSKGDFIALLDQDDMWYPNHLEVLSRHFLENPNLTWVYSDLDEMDEKGLVINRNFIQMLGGEHPKMKLSNLLAMDMFILPSATLIKKSHFLEVGGFDNRLSGYEDDDLFLRMFRRGYLHEFIDQSLSAWRIYGGSTSYSPRMSNSRRIYAQKLIENYPNDSEMGRYWIRDCIAPRFFNNALGIYLNALNNKKWEICEVAYKDMMLYVSYLPLGQKMKLKMLIMRNPKLHAKIRSFKYKVPVQLRKLIP